jgi:hypothetical protein
MLVAPVGEHRTFVLGSGYIGRDEVDRLDAKRPEVSNRPRTFILVRDAAPDKLAFHNGVRRFVEHCDPRGHTAVNKVGGFEHAGAIGVDHHYDDVGGFNAVVDNKRPPSRPENRLSDRG